MTRPITGKDRLYKIEMDLYGQMKQRDGLMY